MLQTTYQIGHLVPPIYWNISEVRSVSPYMARDYWALKDYMVRRLKFKFFISAIVYSFCIRSWIRKMNLNFELKEHEERTDLWVFEPNRHLQPSYHLAYNNNFLEFLVWSLISGFKTVDCMYTAIEGWRINMQRVFG